jgi:hypothetical protein
MRNRVLWKLLSYTAAAGTGLLIRRSMNAGWDRTLGAPPRNPAVTRSGWGNAIAWAAAAGMAVGIGRMLARQGAAAVWQRVADESPPAEA